MYGVQPHPRDRILSAAGAAGLCAALGYALIMGLGVSLPSAIPDALKTFAVGPPPPPPPPEKVLPRPTRSHRPEGAASPANLRSKATELVAPIPIVPPIIPPPVVAALKPGVGSEATTGAAPVPGPGTGAGVRAMGPAAAAMATATAMGGTKARPGC
ncbi:hypothetical protein [Sphingomonas sp. 22R3R2A-7]|uniref:hypothetical protein n=1 Tax=Sphingomonas sp. 22R3R2A-7 TaxID=3050230 RepID=UPI002FE325E1